jgi:hypothetical protein
MPKDSRISLEVGEFSDLGPLPKKKLNEKS